MGPADDDTLRLKPEAPSRPRPALPRALAVLLGIGAVAGLTWYWTGPTPPPAPPPVAAPAPAPRAAIPLVAEADLAALLPERPALVRLAENPRVFLLLFPDLNLQAAALNRVAALVEKAGLPRDRLLDPAELEAAIARSGDTPATWYLGHDYRAADLARFFALAERDRVPLNEAELWVRDQLALASAEAGAGPLALISAAAPGPQMDAAMRASVLRHEIGHGHYFTLPGFAEHVRQVWREGFSEAERDGFRSFLTREGYDPTNEDLLANEAMAYLLFTPDPRFFSPDQVGLPPAVVERLRGLMQAGLALP
ncbi:hypothetical protein JMJ55_16330 [Belnapia sp. T6]|uniref:Uncharacterized protein n=1 Tax=Belnapia mucosa TaxID=2804532 RepID=A0ABS1V5E8_9PROT|nr:hypothetical protein [Belnapia mucosa]MBL6456905.1 hypothetical protein [Belnapia mucosa]